MPVVHVEHEQSVPAIFQVIADAGSSDVEQMFLFQVRGRTAKDADQNAEGTKGEFRFHGMPSKMLVNLGAVKKTNPAPLESGSLGSRPHSLPSPSPPDRRHLFLRGAAFGED